MRRNLPEPETQQAQQIFQAAQQMDTSECLWLLFLSSLRRRMNELLAASRGAAQGAPEGRLLLRKFVLDNGRSECCKALQENPMVGINFNYT